LEVNYELLELKNQQKQLSLSKVKHDFPNAVDLAAMDSASEIEDVEEEEVEILSVDDSSCDDDDGDSSSISRKKNQSKDDRSTAKPSIPTQQSRHKVPSTLAIAPPPMEAASLATPKIAVPPPKSTPIVAPVVPPAKKGIPSSRRSIIIASDDEDEDRPANATAVEDVNPNIIVNKHQTSSPSPSSSSQKSMDGISATTISESVTTAKRKTSWSCISCTYENHPSDNAEFCDMCR
jgi:hypothetical protein